MLWMVQHLWTEGERFDFNCYKHWAKLLFRRTGEDPVIILSREGVSKGYPLSMVLYGITLVTLAEELHTAALDFLEPFYVENATFYGPLFRSARLMTILLELGPARG